MSQPDDFSTDDPQLPPPLDLSRWRKLPGQFMVIGALVTLFGALYSYRHDGLVNFGCSWLVAFMFFLSLGLGSLFLVLVHHLFDAGWSVATRRLCEHLASLLFPWMAILFIPIAVTCRRILTVRSRRKCRCSPCPDFMSPRSVVSWCGGC
jgi:hypothetical protein